MLRFHTQTGGSTLTAQQPENNVIRVTLQALAAVLGGTQSLHTNSLDEALGLPTERAAQIALRTQQVIAHESGVADTVDPLAGSYVIETLTDSIEAGAREYIARIDAMGGALKAIERGYVQSEIQDAAYRYQQGVDRGTTTVVGVNAFQSGGARSPIEIQRINPAIEAAACERIGAYRSARDSVRAAEMRAQVEAVARGDANLVPVLIAAVEAGLTLGELANALRTVWGEYQPTF